MLIPGRDGVYLRQEPCILGTWALLLEGKATMVVLSASPSMWAVVLEAIEPNTQGRVRWAISMCPDAPTLDEWVGRVSEAMVGGYIAEDFPPAGIASAYGLGSSDESFCRQVAGYHRHCIAASQLVARIASPQIEAIMNQALGIAPALVVEVPVPLQYQIMRYEGGPVHAARVLRLLAEYLPPRGAAAIHLALQVLER